jgi:hypothetical protein
MIPKHVADKLQNQEAVFLPMDIVILDPENGYQEKRKKVDVLIEKPEIPNKTFDPKNLSHSVISPFRDLEADSMGYLMMKEADGYSRVIRVFFGARCWNHRAWWTSVKMSKDEKEREMLARGVGSARWEELDAWIGSGRGVVQYMPRRVVAGQPI